MAITLSRIHHVGIIVQDLDRTVAFYNALLGTEPSIRTEVGNSAGLAQQMQVGQAAGDADAKIAFYDVDNTSLEFIEVVRPQQDLHQQPVAQPGAKHLCFQVDDAEEAFAALRAAGHEFHAPVVHFDENQPDLKGVNWAYFEDPDGNVLEIMEDPNKKGVKGAAQKVGLAKG
ncbi:VOC family protein [Parvularcula dongshanensis]|uniref:Catechol 2,3-dioxygenase-like lactoylglutathione lyase family enzyme n=1 Tax=Parvularcula dongshanensis TaxID=1173995 RepID=A0A840I2A5_9PROT|nr:VOC family protein [Parvularcula dongshanensis]MBB4658465.1 catechol 2,3-dioxygenase-like lactoylglutathione lyase family enzyme [Parvularcula dongshanensis]